MPKIVVLDKNVLSIKTEGNELFLKLKTNNYLLYPFWFDFVNRIFLFRVSDTHSVYISKQTGVKHRTKVRCYRFSLSFLLFLKGAFFPVIASQAKQTRNTHIQKISLSFDFVNRTFRFRVPDFPNSFPKRTSFWGFSIFERSVQVRRH